MVLVREPRRTLNASECVARGCALQCGMPSPTFRVRDYEVQDLFPFSIGFSTEEGPVCTLSNGTLFPKGQPVPSIKVLAVHRTNTFQLEAFYTDQSELPSGVSPQISYFMIVPFQGSHADKAKVKVRVQLNIHGIVSLESACLVEDQVDDPVTRGNTYSSLDKVEPGNIFRVSSDAIHNHTEDGSSLQPEFSHVPSGDGTRKKGHLDDLRYQLVRTCMVG